jgi:chromosome partitioning protein
VFPVFGTSDFPVFGLYRFLAFAIADSPGFVLSCTGSLTGSPRSVRMAIVTFAQVKGGSGKTTLAKCMVAEFVARGASVAALDLDPNRPLGRFFARVPELAGVEVAAPDAQRRVSTLVRDLASRFDNVVIDLMGAATNDTQVALALSDLVVVPSQMGEDDFRGGIETWRQVEEAEVVARRRIARGVLMVRTSAGAVRPRVEGFLRDAYTQAGAHVLTATFGERTVWKEMNYAGWVPPLHERGGNAAENFAAVFDELMALLAAAEGAAAAA